MTIDTKAIAQALGMSRRGVELRAANEGWLYQTKGRSRAWVQASLPSDVQTALVAKASAPVLAPCDPVAAVFTSASDKGRQTALDRALFLRTLEREVGPGRQSVGGFVAQYNAGLVLPTLRCRLGEVSTATAYRWLEKWKAEEGRIDALVPAYGLAGRGESQLTIEEKAILAGLFLTPQRWSMSHCHKVMKLNLPTSQASLDQARRYLGGLPKPLVDLRRRGRERFENENLPDLDRNPMLYDSMQQVVSDHHCLDFLVHRHGQNFRPWITTFQDYRSGKIVGWCPSIYPSSVSIGVAFVRMVSAFGAPGLIHIDNGKDYKSRMFRGFEVPMRVFSEEGEDDRLVEVCGVFQVCGVEHAYARPYHGKSKGRQERTFGTFAQYFSREFPTYLGSDVTERTDDSELYFRSIKGKAKKPVEVSWDDFVTKLEAFVPYWNATWVGNGKGRAGQTADQVFESGRKPKREVDPQLLEMVFGQPAIRVVRKSMVEIDNGKYFHPDLFEYNGRQVVARRLIHDPETVIVTHPQGGLIARATYNPFEDTGDMESNLRNLARARKDIKAREKLMISAAPTRGAAGFLDKAMERYPAALASSSPVGQLTSARQVPALPMAAGGEGDHHPDPQPWDGLRSLLDDEPVRPVQTPIKDFLMEQ